MYEDDKVDEMCTKFSYIRIKYSEAEVVEEYSHVPLPQLCTLLSCINSTLYILFHELLLFDFCA